MQNATYDEDFTYFSIHWKVGKMISKWSEPDHIIVVVSFIYRRDGTYFLKMRTGLLQI